MKKVKINPSRMARKKKRIEMLKSVYIVAEFLDSDGCDLQ